MQNIFTKNKKLTVIVISAVLVLAILVTAAVGIASMMRAQYRFNYLTDDISSYISFGGDYKNTKLELSIDAVVESDINEYIAKVLVDNKPKSARYNGAGVKNMPIAVGDLASIYYRGYTVDENGVETEIANANNFSSSSADDLEIGSGSFIPGFELGLVGKNPSDYTKLERQTSGLVLNDTVIYITYSALYPDGNGVVDQTARIDLASDVDAAWGSGFEAYMIGKEIGRALSDAKTVQTSEGDTVYYDITVNYAIKSEDNPITVKAYFPYDYQEEALRCKEVLFDVYVESVVKYYQEEYVDDTVKYYHTNSEGTRIDDAVLDFSADGMIMLTDAFVGDVLKKTDADFEGLEGSLASKHRIDVENTLKEQYDSEYAALVEEQLWAELAKLATVKSYPASAVSEVYNEYYEDLVQQYEQYGSSYSSIAAFAYVYYEISDGTDYTTYITNQAQGVVKEKLIFYYIARTYDLLPTNEEREKIVNETLEEYVSYYLENDPAYGRDKYDSDEAYNEAVVNLKKDIVKYYGQSYFDEIAYYQVVSEKIQDEITINIVGGRGHD